MRKSFVVLIISSVFGLLFLGGGWAFADCSDATVHCYTPTIKSIYGYDRGDQCRSSTPYPIKEVGKFTYGRCYDTWDACCKPCQDHNPVAECNARFPAQCNGNCDATTCIYGTW